jgi:hypothetical protein
MIAVYGIFLLCIGIQYILQIVGGVLCLSAPPESGAKGLGIGVLICTLLPILYVLLIIADQFLQIGVLSMVAALGWLGTILVEMILFVLFLRQVGIALQDEELRKRAMSLAIWWGVFVGDYALTICGGVVLFMVVLGSAIGAAVNVNPDGSGSSTGTQAYGAMAILGIVVGLVLALVWLVLLIMFLVSYFRAINSGVRVIRGRLAGSGAG